MKWMSTSGTALGKYYRRGTKDSRHKIRTIKSVYEGNTNSTGLLFYLFQ